MSELWIGGLHSIHLAWYEAQDELFLLDELLQVYELWMAIFYGGITMGRSV